MQDKTAILFVPAPEWKEVMLREGTGRSRPPTVWAGRGQKLFSLDEHIIQRTAPGFAPSTLSVGGDGISWKEVHIALALVWENQVLEEGVDRLLRVLHKQGWGKSRSLADNYPLWLVEEIADVAQHLRMGTKIQRPRPAPE